VLPTTSVVRIVLSRLSADDSNDSVAVIDGYSTTRISLLFSSTKQGHRQARPQCQVVGSNPENDRLANVVIHATNGLKSSEDTAAREHRTSSRDRIFPQCSDRCVVAAAASSGQFSIAAGEAGNKMVSVPTVAILSRSRRSNSGLIAYHLFLPAQIVGWLRSAERRSVTSFGSSSATALRLSLRRSPREPAQASPTRQHSPGRPTGREPSESLAADGSASPP
jgi:hypothetical protein